MKNAYLLLIIIIGIAASTFIYISSQGNTEESINTLSKTSTKFVKSINACKNARLDIGGQIFQLKNEIATTSIDGEDGVVSLKYGNHAVRGYMDSGSVNDMVCAYDLTDLDGKTKTYVAVLIGLTEDTFAPVAPILLGDEIDVISMKIEGGKSIIDYTERGTGNKLSKTLYLDGDVLNIQ